MKLHEAIRLGSMLGPQGFGYESMLSDTPCALGAAIRAVDLKIAISSFSGDPMPLMPFMSLKTRWPILRKMVYHLPVSQLHWEPRELSVAIWHLNDLCHWTRERIADFVQTIEDAETATEALSAQPLPTEVPVRVQNRW